MATIPLTRGQVAVVDATDYEYLNQWKWYAAWSKFTKSFYAQRNETLPNGQQKTVRMHRELFGLSRGDGRLIDHISGDTLDNRRSNLRTATRAENTKNRRMSRTNASGFKGVSRKRLGAWTGGWVASIRVNGKSRHLGTFPTPELAHAAYCAASTEYHGEFARTA